MEILSATGLKPYRLLHGDSGLALRGEQLVRVDACPLVKSNLGFILENRKRFACIIGSTGCDMERRMVEVIRMKIKIPVYIFNAPRTDNYEIFSNEIDLLVRELEQYFRIKITKDVIQRECARWRVLRQRFQAIDAKRRAHPSTLSTTTFQKMVIELYKGSVDSTMPDVPEEMSYKPRVYLLGSPLSYESGPLLDLIEKRLRVCGDYNCGLSRDLYINVAEPTIKGIKDAYYNLPPYIFRRPNRGYFEWLEKDIKATKSTGIIVHVLDYCDNFDFEVVKMEKRFNLPVLKLKSDFSFQNQSQLLVRIEAFIEVLASYRSGVV